MCFTLRLKDKDCRIEKLNSEQLRLCCVFVYVRCRTGIRKVMNEVIVTADIYRGN